MRRTYRSCGCARLGTLACVAHRSHRLSWYSESKLGDTASSRGAKRRSDPESACVGPGLLRFARNDEAPLRPTKTERFASSRHDRNFKFTALGEHRIAVEPIGDAPPCPVNRARAKKEAQMPAGLRHHFDRRWRRADEARRCEQLARRD